MPTAVGSSGEIPWKQERSYETFWPDKIGLYSTVNFNRQMLFMEQTWQIPGVYVLLFLNYQMPIFDLLKNLDADFRIHSSADEQMHIYSASFSFDLNFELLTPAPSFNMDSHIGSPTVFHWYVPNGSQLSGPWRPIEGRENWTGETDWWKSQIKQIMAANIDVLWVHLIPTVEHIRVNLFRALNVDA